MNKKIFRSSLLTVCLVLAATIALIMGLLFHFFEKKSHNGTEKQNPCKIRNESVGVVFFRAWSLRRRVYFSGDFLSQFSDSFLSQRRIFGGYGYIGHFKSYVFG